MTREQRLEILRSIRTVQGLSWVMKYASRSKAERERMLKPIIKVTKDKDVRKALENVMKYGKEKLEKMAGSPGNYDRLFYWRRYKKYQRELMREVLPGYRAAKRNRTQSDSMCGLGSR